MKNDPNTDFFTLFIMFCAAMIILVKGLLGLAHWIADHYLEILDLIGLVGAWALVIGSLIGICQAVLDIERSGRSDPPPKDWDEEL